MLEPPVIAVDRDPDVVIVRILAEHLDQNHVGRFQTEIQPAIAANPGMPFVLDLTRVRFMPSFSLGALIRLANGFKSRQQRLMVAGLQPHVHDLFVVTRLDGLFDLHADVPAAVGTLRPV